MTGWSLLPRSKPLIPPTNGSVARISNYLKAKEKSSSATFLITGWPVIATKLKFMFYSYWIVLKPAGISNCMPLLRKRFPLKT